jgi:hypothetical protein
MAIYVDALIVKVEETRERPMIGARRFPVATPDVMVVLLPMRYIDPTYQREIVLRAGNGRSTVRHCLFTSLAIAISFYLRWT